MSKEELNMLARWMSEVWKCYVKYMQIDMNQWDWDRLRDELDRIWEGPRGTPNRDLGGGNIYYHAPKRVWAYNRMAPPGMPGFFAVREATWERVAWSDYFSD